MLPAIFGSFNGCTEASNSVEVAGGVVSARIVDVDPKVADVVVIVDLMLSVVGDVEANDVEVTALDVASEGDGIEASCTDVGSGVSIDVGIKVGVEVASGVGVGVGSSVMARLGITVGQGVGSGVSIVVGADVGLGVG